MPSAKMPKSGYFFDTIVRQPPIDDNNLQVEDNLEEFGLLSKQDIEYWANSAAYIKTSDKGIIANFGGTGLGDIALVPAPWLKNPKGIRDIAEWYSSTLMRSDYIKEVFDKQTDIAVENFKTLFAILGNSIDVVYMCGSDFGTQDSQFCSPEGFADLYLPYYQKMNNWIHTNTHWKTFKHSCGAILPLLPSFIEAGFDIINPVQISAKDMDSKILKEKFGDKITFWGGGVDTQKVLSFGNFADVEKQVLRQCEIFGRNGGFVFNTVHNIQANVPVENIAAMVSALKKFNQ
jgi:uroporphyrinogen-III decarboxylase